MKLKTWLHCFLILDSGFAKVRTQSKELADAMETMAKEVERAKMSAFFFGKAKCGKCGFVWFLKKELCDFDNCKSCGSKKIKRIS